MAQSNQGSTGRSWTTKHMVWASVVSLAVGAIVTYEAGFNWVGAWETGKEVQQKQAISACVEEFLLQPDRGVIYTTLKGMDSSYQRRKVIRDHELASDFTVEDACGDQIRNFDATLFPSA